MTRLVCSKERPYDPRIGNFWAHPDAKYLGQNDCHCGLSFRRLRCPNCGIEFEEELPQ